MRMCKLEYLGNQTGLVVTVQLKTNKRSNFKSLEIAIYYPE